MTRLMVMFNEKAHLISTTLPLVPNHNWSASILNVSLTLPPALLYMPESGTYQKRHEKGDNYLKL